MEVQKAEQYHLFKHYDFGIHFTGGGGTGILLIPKGNLYVPKNYGFGCLALAPYIQEPFNEDKKIEMGDLIRELEEENEIVLIPSEIDRMLGRKEPFLHSILNRFRKHGIIKIEKKAGLESKIDIKDIISAGENYGKVRVFRMYENDRRERDFPWL